VAETDNIRRRKLGFRACHRGILEMDILFTVFVKNHLGSLSLQELDLFEELLEESDHDILSWISGAAETPDRANNTVLDQMKTIALRPEDYGA
jgi:antitoxin CptB